MNDPLESELESLAPRALSPDFMPRLDTRLPAPRPAHSFPRRLFLTALAAAACLAITTLILHEIRTPRPDRALPEFIEAAAPGPLPTLAQFEHAFQQSPDAVDALLQPRPVGQSQQQVVRTYDATCVQLN